MKLNKIILLLTLALSATLATTGCKHPVPKVTNLPDHGGGVTGDQPSNPLPPGGQLPEGPAPGTGAGTQVGGGPLADWDPGSMNQDREKLAAYTVHFKFDSAVVEDSDQANVSSVAQALSSDPNAKLLIEGHCDERGTEEYNRALGEKRALALREALARGGVDPMRIRTISYGKDKPVDPEHFEAAWAKNRRGEFVWCTPKTAAP